MKQKAYQGRDVYVVDGARSPFLKAKGKPGPFTAADLAIAACRPLMERQKFSAEDIEEVITGCTMASPDEANISRVIALRLGCGDHVPAWTVQRNCASGMQALDNAAQSITTGRHDLVLAGGVDVMSHAPLLFNKKMVNWFAAWMRAKTVPAKFKTLAMVRPDMFAPVIAILRGLTDPVVGLSMGQTAENLAYRFNITREQMDEFALNSHKKLAKTQEANFLTEIETIYDHHGKYYQQDDGVRADTTLEKLASLKPFFDKKYGNVTAGNSSQVTDGAAFLILASEDAVKKYDLPVLGKIVDCEWAALDPAQMGLGPVFSTVPLMQRNNLKINDVDFWEMNEAFAAQVLACLHCFNDKEFCQENFGLTDKLGEVSLDKFNIRGGAIAMGHPIGASGARLILQLLNILKQENGKTGIANVCVGGGQGGAMLVKAKENK